MKLVTTLMANTKGEGTGGDPFWEKSEKLLYTALIAYLHYDAPAEEQNFATLLQLLNAMKSERTMKSIRIPWICCLKNSVSGNRTPLPCGNTVFSSWLPAKR